jgi:hypothetical protein
MQIPRIRIHAGLFLWAALLASGPISAQGQSRVYKAPYVDCSHWKKDTRGIDKARSSCNRQSGALGVLAQASAGAAAADAMQAIHFTVNQDSKVTFETDITYAGGASTNASGRSRVSMPSGASTAATRSARPSIPASVSTTSAAR